MPLTICHPAAAIPFARSGLVLSALVIGSMTPDFPYFIPLFSFGKFSHTLPGLFAYCLPVGLVSLGVFHFLMKVPVLSLLPASHQSRLYDSASGFSFWPLRRLLLIILSILIGALTHIVWDAFTHRQGWVVQQFMILQSPILAIGSHPVRTYELLQHGSTVVGGILLFYWYVAWYKGAKPTTVPINLMRTASTKILIVVMLSFIAFAVAIASGLANIPATAQSSLYSRLFIGHVFIVSVSTFTAELMLFSAYWHFRTQRKISRD